MFDLKKPVVMLGLLVLALVACTTPTPVVRTPAPSPGVFVSPVATRPPSNVPAAGPLVSPLPGPTTVTPPGAISAPGSTAVVPDAGKGAATGILRRVDGSPMRGVLVYAALIERQNGVALASVDAVKDPRVTTGKDGSFAFIGLAPGEYGLVAQSPWGLVLLETQDAVSIRFRVTVGEVIRLGTLAVGYDYPDGD